jgi:hypothetical protein
MVMTTESRGDTEDREWPISAPAPSFVDWVSLCLTVVGQSGFRDSCCVRSQ